VLIHKPSNTVVLRLRDPNRVTSVIPKARTVEHNGQVFTQVHYGLDEVKVLNNLNIRVPSPIQHNYDWAGKFTPMQHQATTSAFLTMNHRAICLNDMGCVDASTEYLSPVGWRRIDEYNGSEVAQYHPETGAIEFVRPTEYVKKPCPSMIRIKTSRGVDQLLSPEHRVLYVGSTGKTAVASASDVARQHHAAKYGWKGRIITTFEREVKTQLPITDEALRLQVALMADGHFPNKTSAVSLRLKKLRKVTRLRELLTAAGVPYTEGQSGDFKVFRFNAPLKTKTYGPAFWVANTAQMRVIAEECIHWDGSVRKGGGMSFFSTDKASADFIQYAFASTGRTARITEDVRDGRATCYCVHARSNAALLYITGQKADKTKSDTVWSEPSPDGFKYCFVVPSTFLLLRRNGCIFATGNTGKTLSVLWAADYLMKVGKMRKVLIVGPMSTMHSVWQSEINTHFLFRRRCVVLHGPKAKRLKLLEEEEAVFYIINHDGIKTIAKELAAANFDAIVVDEAASFRNAQTSRYKVLEKLTDSAQWLWLLTGTPVPTAPTDAWALAKLLKNTDAPKYFTHFKTQVMDQLTSYKWVPKADAYTKAYGILQPGVRYTKEDCMDLPPVTFNSYECALTKEQLTAYKEMHKELVMEVAGTQITAANAAVKLGKLLQVCCGEVYDEHGGSVTVNSSNRQATCAEIIEGAAKKVIVFVPFTATLDKLAAYLRRKGNSVAVVDGRTTANKRKKIFEDFQNAKDPRVLVAHPQTTAHGLTLTAADTTIWYAPVFSLEIFEQANNRMNRPGQNNHMTVAMLHSCWLEREVYAALSKKAAMQDSVLQMYREELNTP